MTELIYNLKIKGINLRVAYSFICVICFALYQNCGKTLNKNKNDDMANVIFSFPFFVSTLVEFH